jgi:hypothetical protein
MIRWGAAGLVAAAVLCTGSAAAQQGEQIWRWIDGQGGFCVWYLADPAIAVELVPGGTALRTAAQTSDLPAVLIRLAQDEPRFADWIPGVVCVARYADVAADGVPVGHMEDGRPITMTLTAVAAHAPAGQDEAQWHLAEIGVDAGDLEDVAREVGLPVREREFRSRTTLEGEDDAWEMSLDGARLAWTGHPTGDSRVGSTRSMSFGYAGDRNSRYLVVVRTAPAEVQSQIGALRVEGKDPLAQAMKSSPIRAVGPLERGGELLVTFRPGS